MARREWMKKRVWVKWSETPETLRLLVMNPEQILLQEHFLSLPVFVLYNKKFSLSPKSLCTCLVVSDPGHFTVLGGGCVHVYRPSLFFLPCCSDRKRARLRSTLANSETFRLCVKKTRWHHSNGIALWQIWEGDLQRVWLPLYTCYSKYDVFLLPL